MSTNLSEYELARLENIKKNEEFLKSLGLYKDPAEVAKQQETVEKRKKANSQKKKAHRVNTDDTAIVRRSTRNSLSEVAVKDENLLSLSDIEESANPVRVKRKYAPLEDAEAFFKIKTEDNDEDDESEAVKLTPDELRSFVLAASEEHSDKISDEAIQLCAYRCSYMSVAALRNRLNGISRGAGNKSKEKLLAVTYAMRAMGLMKLSEISAQYLKRNTGIEVSWYKSTSSSSGSGGDGQSSSSSNENVADTNDEGDMLVKEEPASDSVVAAVKEGQDAENLPPDVNVENRREDVVVQIKLEPHVCAAAAAADALTPGFRQRKSPRRRSSETENKEDTYW